MSTAVRAYRFLISRHELDNGHHALAKPVAPKKKCKTESDFKVKSQV